jgi:DNA polymerase (family 10)
MNAQSDRLDLSSVQARIAKQIGVLLVINTDSQRVEELEFMRYGVDQARQAWLEAGDVSNMLSLEDMLSALQN